MTLARRTASPWGASRVPARSPPAAAGRRKAARDRMPPSPRGLPCASCRRASSGAALADAASPARGPDMTFSSAVMWLNRLNCWNTMPMWRRCCDNTASDTGHHGATVRRYPSSSPSIRTRAPIRRSRWLRQRRNVLLPLPAGADDDHDLAFSDRQVDAAQHVVWHRNLVDALRLHHPAAAVRLHHATGHFEHCTDFAAASSRRDPMPSPSARNAPPAAAVRTPQRGQHQVI